MLVMKIKHKKMEELRELQQQEGNIKTRQGVPLKPSVSDLKEQGKLVWDIAVC